MVWGAIRRTLAWISVSLVFVFLFAPGRCNARPLYAGASPHPPMALAAVPGLMNPGLMNVLLFGILGLAAAAAAVAVRMVRRSH